jgi:hypothetical protein
MKTHPRLLQRFPLTLKDRPTSDSCLDGRPPVANRQGQQTSRPVLRPLVDYFCRIAAKLDVFVAWEQLWQRLQQLLL